MSNCCSRRRPLATRVVAYGVAALVVLSANSRDLTAQGRHVGDASFVGCYALLFSTGQRVDSTANHAAPAVRLDTARYGPGPGNGQYRLSRLSALGAPPRVPAVEGRVPPTWRISPAADSLHLSFVNGFEGASFAFEIPRVRSDTLRGRTENITDYAPPAGRRTAFAVRIDCR